MSEVAPKPWLVVFLVYIDFITDDRRSGPKFNIDLARELDSMLGDIVSGDLDKEKCKIFLVYSSLNYEWESNAGTHPYKVRNATLLYSIDSDFPNDNKISFIDAVDSENIHSFSTLNLPDYSVQKKEKLTSIFNKIRKHVNKENNDYVNHQVLLITWDHGSGFGIFQVEAHARAQLVEWRSLEQMTEYRYINRLIKATPKNFKISEVNQEENEKVFIVDNYLIPENKPTYGDTLNYLLNEAMDSESTVAVLERQGGYILKLDKIKGNDIGAKVPATLPSGLISINKNKFLEDREDIEIRVQPQGVAEILTNEELADSVQDGLKSVDVLLMMNCIMMNIHTAYALKDCVHYLVAPQNDISEPGYNYAAILKALNSEQISAKDLANLCVKSSYSLDGPRARFTKDIDTWAIFGMDLRSAYFQSLIDIIDEIADYFILSGENSKEVEYLIFYTIKHNFNFAGSKYLIDLFTWILNLEHVNTNEDTTRIIKDLPVGKFSNRLRLYASELMMQEKKYYMAYKSQKHYRGSVYYPPYGLSIYLPARVTSNNPGYTLYISPPRSVDGNNQSRFIHDHPKWLEFLKKFLVLPIV